MNKQEVFNKVYAHLTTMKAQAADEQGNCVYDQAVHGGCAVGCLLPDKHPSFEFQGDVEDLLEEFPDLQGHFGITYDEDYRLRDEPFVSFLWQLQQLHDEHTNWTAEGLTAEARQQLRIIGLNNGLEVPA